AYLVFGLTGFGSTVISLPLLAHLLPLKLAVALLLLLDLAAFLAFGLRFRRGIRIDEIRWLVPAALIGMLIGVTLLIRVAESWLLGVLGAFVLCYAAYGLSRRGAPARLPRWAGVPIGLGGGAFSAMFGTGGVVFAIYNAGRIHDKGELRASNAAMIAFSSIARLVLFGLTGLLAQDGLWTLFALLLPALGAGVLLGHRLHAAVPAALVVRAVYMLLLFAGASILLRVWGGA
ncbi:MAG: sulfite exporter TauE/SafE family protein, partial [Burkholderiales bacterium]|nr:sulfite exporter TauE/SafE family protein [Burkholderiales bacterium]